MKSGLKIPVRPCHPGGLILKTSGLQILKSAGLYWKIGKRVNEETLNNKRAEYGKQIVSKLCGQLVENFRNSFSEKNIRRMMQFAEVFPDEQIVVSAIRQLSWTQPPGCVSQSSLPRVVGKPSWLLIQPVFLSYFKTWHDICSFGIIIVVCFYRLRRVAKSVLFFFQSQLSMLFVASWLRITKPAASGLPIPQKSFKNFKLFFTFFSFIINKIKNIFKKDGTSWPSHYICICAGVRYQASAKNDQ